MNKIFAQFEKIAILETSLLAIVLSLLLWPSYLTLKIQALPGINLTRVLIFLTLLLWIFGVLINRFYQFHLFSIIKKYRFIIVYILLPFFCWRFFTAYASSAQLSAVYATIKDVIYLFLLFLISVNVFRRAEQIDRLVKILILASLCIAVITTIEVIFQQNLFARFVPDTFGAAQRLREGLFRDLNYRPSGTFPHPLALACCCTTVLPLVFWYCIVHVGHLRLFGICGCVSLLWTIYLSTSRAGLIVLAFMGCGWLVMNVLPDWIRKSKGKIASKTAFSYLSVFAFLVTLGFIGQTMVLGRTAREAGSSALRIVQMELGAPLIMAKPIMGYGAGEAADILGLSTKTVDNLYLSLALESGIPSVVLFIAIFSYFLWTAWQMKGNSTKFSSTFAIAIFWSTLGNVLFFTIVSLDQSLPLTFIFFGLLISLHMEN